jgi:hypothetical protein
VEPCQLAERPLVTPTKEASRDRSAIARDLAAAVQ